MILIKLNWFNYYNLLNNSLFYLDNRMKLNHLICLYNKEVFLKNFYMPLAIWVFDTHIGMKNFSKLK